MDKDNIMSILSGLNAFLKTNRGKSDGGNNADKDYGGENRNASSSNSFNGGNGFGKEPPRGSSSNNFGSDSQSGGGLFGSFFSNGNDKKSAPESEGKGGRNVEKENTVSAEYTKLPEQMSYPPELLNALSKYEAHMKNIGKK